MFKESNFSLVKVVLPRVSHWKSRNLIVGVWNFAALNSYLKDLLATADFPQMFYTYLKEVMVVLQEIRFGYFQED